MSQTHPRAFIFDMDGTLVDNMAYHARTWVDVLAEDHGLTLSPEEFSRRTAGWTTREIAHTFVGTHLSDEEIAALNHRKESRYREVYLPHRTVTKGALEFLEAAKRLGLKMAVATAAPSPNVEFILDGLDLRRYFDVVVGVEDISRGKPDPEIFLLTAARLNLPPEACIVFEDAASGIEGARRAGMQAIAITTTLDPAEVHDLPHVLLAAKDFTGLDAAQIIHSNGK